MGRLLWDAFDGSEWTPPEQGGSGHYPQTVDPPNATETLATYDVVVSAPGYIQAVTVRVFDVADLETRDVTVLLDPISIPVIPTPSPLLPSRPMRSTRRLWNPQG